MRAIGDEVRAQLRRRLNGGVGMLPVEVPRALDAAHYRPIKVDVGTLWMAADDDVARPYMERRGTWEPEIGLVLKSFLKPGARFLDIGANIGYFSVFASRTAPGISIDAVEPDPTSIDALRMNLWANNVRARVWPLALDDRERSLVLRRTEHNRGDNRVRKINDTQAPSSDSDVVVPAIRGDTLFEGRSFDVVKIDVQGWELEVLLGLQATFSGSAGIHVVTEFYPSVLLERARDPREVLARYHELGYRVKVIVKEAAVELSDAEIVAICASAGADGQVNLVLSRA